MDITARATYRGQITKLSNTVSEYLNSPDSQVKTENADKFDAIEEDLQVYLERIAAAKDSLAKANNEVRLSIKEEDIAKECESVADYDDKAVAVIARIKQRLKKIRAQQNFENCVNDNGISIPDPPARPVSSNCAMKLPKLNLKKFCGELKEWLPFWEQFRTSVHENANLSDIEKFNYLQSLLVGRAADSIAGLTPTQANYETAVALLREEYGNSDKIVDRTLQQLMALPAVHSRHDASGLRRLYNTVTASTRSLTALGIPTSHYSIMLKGVLLKCMPPDLRIDFHREGTDVDAIEKNTTVEQVEAASNESTCSPNSVRDKQFSPILKFLKREVEALEMASESRSARAQTSTSTNKLLKTATGLITPCDSRAVCCFCKSAQHLSIHCDADITLSERKEKLKQQGRCFKCTKRGHNSKVCRNRTLRCSRCSGKHCTPMCDPNFKKKLGLFSSSDSDKQSPDSVQNTTNLHSSCDEQLSTVYLQTACAYLTSAKGMTLFARVIFDGCSQRSYIREDISRELNLEVVDTVNISILPFGSDKKAPQCLCNRVRVSVKSQHDASIVSIVAVEVPNICLDILPVPNENIKEFCNILLADSRINGEPRKGISLLIGADYYWCLVGTNIKRLSSRLTAINTSLGWTIQGPLSNEDSCDSSECITAMVLHGSTISDDTVRKFWDLETIGIMNLEVSNVNVNIDKYISKQGLRYKASLLWRNDEPVLNDNKQQALARLDKLVIKLKRNFKDFREYDSAMWQLINEGIAERCNPSNNSSSNFNRKYYMPHRPVYKEESLTTKMRIVFDASSKSGNNLSLNDNLIAGPNLLPDILSILLNFRTGLIGLVADVEKAFLQIELANEDRDALRFIWFKRRIEHSLDTCDYAVYRMARVPFGVTCSPFLLAATLNKHLKNESKIYPRTCQLLQRSFYMDDLIISLDEEKAAFTLYRESCEILKRASMNLRKWNSNSPSLCRIFPQNPNPPDSQGVLGVTWSCSTDELSVDIAQAVQSLPTIKLTKQSVLQFIARVYDPLGILGPVMVGLKILFQNIWRQKLNWHEPLPPDLSKNWNVCTLNFEVLSNITIPRCSSPLYPRSNVELHIFADASPNAYGAVAYIRTSGAKVGDVVVRYLVSKNRVAPLKESGDPELTLPKLELTASLIASRLMHFIQKNMDISWNAIFLWSDSRITLHWIHGDIRRWKPYITHRVNEIRSLTGNAVWKFCPGDQNPADMLTRGLRPDKLVESTSWFNGPAWLSNERNNWPDQHVEECDTLSLMSLMLPDEERQVNGCTKTNIPIDISRFSRYERLLRVTAYTLRFALRQGCQYSDVNVNAAEMQRAESFWVKLVQRQFYGNEVDLLSEADHKSIRSSTISDLDPFVDDQGILRAKTRIQEADLGYETEFPIILPKLSYLSKLIVMKAHEQLLHAGVNSTLVKVREKFWIIKARQLIKKTLNNCEVCKRFKARPGAQPFAPLPKERLKLYRAFETTGIDFAGPLYVRYTAEDTTTNKIYILLLTCATTRAIHVELVPNLTSESCVMAIRRFISRRGIPKRIISDNALTFKRVSKDFNRIFNSKQIQGFANGHGIEWSFIVERAPWWGGFWERLVKSVKDALKIVIGRSILTAEQLQTFLTEAEYAVNCRPLSYVSDSSSDLTPLTPNHFLLGSCAALPHSNMTNLNITDFQQAWKERLKSTHLFVKRWKTEYIQQLRSAHSRHQNQSGDFREGDVVLLHDSSLPRVLWRLAKIEAIYPGRDGRIRSCELLLPNRSKVRRPIQLLYPLEVSDRFLKHARPEDVENV